MEQIIEEYGIGGILFVFVKNYYERKENKIDLEGM